jgi:predicted metalloendopeptidase
METLTDLVQSKFRDLVIQGSWLSDRTKKLADVKIQAIIHNIGYPDFILDDNLLQSEVEGLNYQQEEFFENVLKNLRWRTEQEMSRLDERVNRTLWTATPAVVNAYYSRNRNQISMSIKIF